MRLHSLLNQLFDLTLRFLEEFTRLKRGRHAADFSDIEHMALSLLVDRIRSAGLDISLCGVKESVMDVMKRTHLLEHIGEDHLYPDLNQALCAVHQDSWHTRGESCPLTTVCRLPGAEARA